MLKSDTKFKRAVVRDGACVCKDENLNDLMKKDGVDVTSVTADDMQAAYIKLKRDVSTTILSLSKVLEKNDFATSQTVLVLDEVRSILHVVANSSNVNVPSNTLGKLENLVRTCKHVVALDQDVLVDNMVRGFFEPVGRPFKILEHPQNPNNVRTLMMCTDKVWRDAIL